MSENFIEELQKRYKLNGELREIEVPEWGVSVYVKPLTMNQLSALQAESSNAERAVMGVILRALDGNGKPLFKKGQKDALMSLPGAVPVIDRLSVQIMEDIIPAEENP